jgi:hypothetical protein
MLKFIFRIVILFCLLISTFSNYSFAQEDYDSARIHLYQAKKKCMSEHSIFLQNHYEITGSGTPYVYFRYLFDSLGIVEPGSHFYLIGESVPEFIKETPKNREYNIHFDYYIPDNRLKEFRKYKDIITTGYTMTDDEKKILFYYNYFYNHNNFQDLLSRVEDNIIKQIKEKKQNRKYDIEDAFELEDFKNYSSNGYTKNWKTKFDLNYLSSYEKYLYNILDNYVDFGINKFNYKFTNAHFNNVTQLDSIIYNDILINNNLQSLTINDKFDTVPGYLKKISNLKYLTIDFEREGDSDRKDIYFDPIFFNDLFKQLPKSVKSIQFEGFPYANVFIPEKYAKEFTLDSYVAGSEWVNYNHHFTPISFYFKASRVNDYNDLCYTRICKKVDENKDSVTYYYPTNTIFAKGCLSTDNKAEGKWEFYHPNGKLSEERYYLNRVETGKWNIYDPRNKLFAQFTFESDTTKLLYFNDDGAYDGAKYYEYTLFNEYTDGYIKKWNEKGEVILNKRYRRNKKLYEEY